MEFDVGARLRDIRTKAGLSQRQLAERAGVPHGQISMVEQNRSSPSVASLRKILGGVPMTLADFFEPDQAEGGARVFFTPRDLVDLTGRLGHGREGSSGLVFRQVGDARAHNLQILHERYEPGGDTGETMLEHVGHEGGVVILGEVELTVGGEARVLKAGDAYLFDSRTPHRFRNVSDRPAEIVSACSPPYL
jgi:transcriptional regulator with XRE-family HTH domain